MAYMNQERKKALGALVKPILKKYAMKGTLSTEKHSITLTLRQGPLDFVKSYNDTTKNILSYERNRAEYNRQLSINVYWYDEQFSGKELDFLKEVISALNTGNYDNSDIQSDYFDVGWYIHVEVGKWDKPYIIEGKNNV